MDVDVSQQHNNNKSMADTVFAPLSTKKEEMGGAYFEPSLVCVHNSIMTEILLKRM